MAGIQDKKFADLGLQHYRSEGSIGVVSAYTRHLADYNGVKPIVVLIHGYPQSSYEWRLTIPLLPSDFPLFVPDLPGYGQSDPPKDSSKLYVGELIINALHSALHRQNGLPIPLILVGHDRGARVIHRLQVSSTSENSIFKRHKFKILGIALLDIIPTVEQWSSFGSSPTAAAGVFHWPFLANSGLASRMIKAYGGRRWCLEMITNWSGSNPNGLESLKSGSSFDVYGDFFDRTSVIEASCHDYEAGANIDVDAQKEDQTEGQKVTVPLLLAYSVDYFGKRADVPEIWKNWVSDPTLITVAGISNHIGHFIAEEAPEETAKALLDWIKTLT